MNNLTMHDPMLLESLSEMYFGLLEHEEKPPTVPGLALALGFNTVRDITQTLKAWEEQVSRYPEASINFLLRSLTRIEEYYITRGIEGSIPPALIKFLMGAYHDRREQEPQVQPGDVANNFQIVFNAPKEFLPQGSTPNQLEHVNVLDMATTPCSQIPANRALPEKGQTGNISVEVSP